MHACGSAVSPGGVGRGLSSMDVSLATIILSPIFTTGFRQQPRMEPDLLTSLPSFFLSRAEMLLVQKMTLLDLNSNV